MADCNKSQPLKSAVITRMVFNVSGIWILTFLFFKIQTVNLQFQMPMYGPAMLPPPVPMFPQPLSSMPMVPRPLLPISVPEASEEKTTTTEISKNKPFQMIFPAFPGMNFKDVKNKKKSLIIPPILAPGPPSFVLVPPEIRRPILPRRRPRKKLAPVYSSESRDSSSSSECYMTKRHRKHIRHNENRGKYRSSENDEQLLKPMLSYVSDNGEIKFETKISDDDVARLLGKDKKMISGRIQTVHVYTKEDESNSQQMIVVSKDNGPSKRKIYQHKKVFLRNGLEDHILSKGKKELIFRPPADKKISNISVSFNIS